MCTYTIILTFQTISFHSETTSEYIQIFELTCTVEHIWVSFQLSNTFNKISNYLKETNNFN